VGVGKLPLEFAKDSAKAVERASPGFPVDLFGAGELHAAFLNESRTRGRWWHPVAGNPGRPSFSAHVRWGEHGAPVRFPSGFFDSVQSPSDFLGYDWDDLKREMEMKVVVFALLGVLSIALYSQQSQPTRIGMIIGIKPDKISAYEALHAASNQGVRDLLDKYHMHNFSIYIHKMDETHYYLFAYYEYTGNNYKQDMDTLAREPRNIAWLSKTDAMQIPLASERSWTKMQEVFHNP
jgi:L-rhamnose mutarotase